MGRGNLVISINKLSEDDIDLLNHLFKIPQLVSQTDIEYISNMETGIFLDQADNVINFLVNDDNNLISIFCSIILEIKSNLTMTMSEKSERYTMLRKAITRLDAIISGLVKAKPKINIYDMSLTSVSVNPIMKQISISYDPATVSICGTIELQKNTGGTNQFTTTSSGSVDKLDTTISQQESNTILQGSFGSSGYKENRSSESIQMPDKSLSKSINGILIGIFSVGILFGLMYLALAPYLFDQSSHISYFLSIFAIVILLGMGYNLSTQSISELSHSSKSFIEIMSIKNKNTSKNSLQAISLNDGSELNVSEKNSKYGYVFEPHHDSETNQSNHNEFRSRKPNNMAFSQILTSFLLGTGSFLLFITLLFLAVGPLLFGLNGVFWWIVAVISVFTLFATGVQIITVGFQFILGSVYSVFEILLNYSQN